MKYLFILLLSMCFLLKYSKIHSQNLIPNPGFEVYDTCPNQISQLDYCNSWTNVSGTSDYFNECNTVAFGTPPAGVPNNYFGHQPAHTGCGYGGIYTHSSDTPIWHECIQAKLDSVLTIGTKYFITFYISLADLGLCSGSNKFGCMLTTSAYPSWSNLIYNYATFYSDSIVTDTVNWTKISGSFIADSAYKYITFGNLFDDSSTQHTIIVGTPNSVYSYYYIDDVCLSSDSMSCVSITNSCTYLDVAEYIKNDLIVYPNPFSDILTFDTKINDELEVNIYDVTSRLILRKHFKSKITLVTNELNSGIYFYKVREDENIISTGKIIK